MFASRAKEKVLAGKGLSQKEFSSTQKVCLDLLSVEDALKLELKNCAADALSLACTET